MLLPKAVLQSPMFNRTLPDDETPVCVPSAIDSRHSSHDFPVFSCYEHLAVNFSDMTPDAHVQEFCRVYI